MTNIRVMIKASRLTFCPINVASSIYHRETKLYYLIEPFARTLVVWTLSICQKGIEVLFGFGRMSTLSHRSHHFDGMYMILIVSRYIRRILDKILEILYCKTYSLSKKFCTVKIKRQ